MNKWVAWVKHNLVKMGRLYTFSLQYKYCTFGNFVHVQCTIHCYFFVHVQYCTIMKNTIVLVFFFLLVNLEALLQIVCIEPLSTKVFSFFLVVFALFSYVFSCNFGFFTVLFMCHFTCSSLSTPTPFSTTLLSFPATLLLHPSNI